MRSFVVNQTMIAKRGRKLAVRRFLSNMVQSPPPPPPSPPPSAFTVAKILKGLAGFTVASTIFSTAYMYSDEGRWRSAQAMYFFSKLGIAYYGVEDEKEKIALHKEWAPKSLDFVVGLGGYYIKAAQTMVGTGYLPDEYSDTFEVLLDNCPSRDYSVVAKVFEDDVGLQIEDVFQTFDKIPAGAGSIGQVHRATLKGSGKPVVVKIQYPGVESFFSMDFKTMTWLMSFGDFGDAMKEVLDEFSKTMVNEFYYDKEAAFLRECSENIMPIYGKSVLIPLPIDSSHPDSPNGQNLCTRMVLTMDDVQGVPIKNHLREMLGQWAKSQNKTISEIKLEMTEIYKDPKKLREAIETAPVSETMTSLYITGVKTLNWILDTNYSVPLNGPKIIRTLCDVHAHQIFVNGVFNSDPHPGNVLQLDDGRLGLIDYGACDRLSLDQRKAFARLCVGLADKDDDKTVEAMKEFGFSSEKNDTRFLLAYAMLCYHRGFHPDDMAKCEIPPEIGPLDVELYLNKFDHINKLSGPMATTQRCAMVLLGLASSIGANGISIAEMFAPTARKFLKDEA
jgi:aarF domain-containing kinase